MQSLTILGATGSIGLNTLDVVARHPERFRIYALSGHRQLDKLATLCRQFKPQVVVVGNVAAAQTLAHELQGLPVEICYGAQALSDIARAPEVDTVMAAIVGAAGLLPTLAAVEAGKKVLLANKEALVMAGYLFMDAVRRSGSVLLPIDSEHNAIFQALPAGFNGDLAQAGVERIILTASGGPFRTYSMEALASVTPGQAVCHPNWVMGRKISVDSASLMNKGLEVIEACWLFNAHPDQIEVVVHPQSVIHSMVRYRDGSVMAQLGSPDMRTPIAHALAWPARINAGVAPLDFMALSALTFEAADTTRFPCLGLAFSALRQGGDAPAVLNAANEVAVDAFLAGHLPFSAMARVIERTLQQYGNRCSHSIDDLLETDRQARAFAQHEIR